MQEGLGVFTDNVYESDKSGNFGFFRKFSSVDMPWILFFIFYFILFYFILFFYFFSRFSDILVMLFPVDLQLRAFSKRDWICSGV